MVASIKPNKEDRKKFDIDLEYGEIKEDQVSSMLQNKKIEVKSERGMVDRDWETFFYLLY